MPTTTAFLLTELENYNQAQEDTLATERAGNSGSCIIFNTTLGISRSWNGTAFVNTAVVAPLIVPIATTLFSGGVPALGAALTVIRVNAAGTTLEYYTPAGGGDMVLADPQTVTGAKTFNDTKLLLRNVANTFNGSFVNTNTADRIYTLQNRAGILADDTDLALKANLASPTFTGTVTLPSGQALIAPVLGTPASGALTNCTFPTLNQNTTGTSDNVTGIVASANGGTGINNAGRTLTINTNSGTLSFATSVVLTIAATASVSGTNTGDQTISDATISTTDITTNNFTTAKHGFVPKGTNVGNFLKDDGTWAAPAGGGGMTTLKKTNDQTINAGAGVFVDVTGLTFAVVSGTDYAFFFYVTFQSSASTTGWKASVNCPTGTLDFWAGSQTIANGAAGVATHTERHNTVRDDMTLLTATVTQAVDLSIRIEGRYKCTANGTFAVRFANELASNTNLVVQKGSFGWYF